MNATRKYSRQREAILTLLRQRCDHPTAETLYFDVKKQYPDISLATVYRNLRLLTADGEILKLTFDASDRFDGTAAPHCHFYCTKCNRVFDMEQPYRPELDESVAGSDRENFQISGHSLYYYGLCKHCF